MICSSLNRLLFISAWVLPRRSLFLTRPVFRGQAKATYEAEEGDWAGEDLALTPDGGRIIAVDSSDF